MKRLIVCTLILAFPVLAAPNPPVCLILRHSSTSEQFWISGANWKYVDGDFPKDMKWKSNVTDRNVRKIKDEGGKVITLDQKYSTQDLETAKKECAEFIAANSKNNDKADSK